MTRLQLRARLHQMQHRSSLSENALRTWISQPSPEQSSVNDASWPIVLIRDRDANGSNRCKAVTQVS